MRWRELALSWIFPVLTIYDGIAGNSIFYFSLEVGMGGSGGAAFTGLSQNPEFMAAIGKSFANQTLTLSKMVEDDEREDYELIFECSSCHFVQSEENMSYSDNTCPHCGSTMYRNR